MPTILDTILVLLGGASVLALAIIIYVSLCICIGKFLRGRLR